MRSDEEISDEVCWAFRLDMQTWVRTGVDLRAKWPQLVGEALNGVTRTGSLLMPIWREVLAVNALLVFVRALGPQPNRKFWCWLETTDDADGAKLWARNAASAACGFAADRWMETHDEGLFVVCTRDVEKRTRRFEVEVSTCAAILKGGREGLHLTTAAKPLDGRSILED